MEDRVFIAMPTTGSIPKETVHSLVSIQTLHYLYLTQHALVHEARNMCVEEFLKSKYDWLYFVDSDMVFAPNIINELIKTAKESNVKFLSTLIFKRTPPYQPCFYMGEGYYSEEKGVLKKSEREIKHSGKPLMKNGDNIVCNLAPLVWANKVVEITSCGMASCLIHRSVIEKMKEEFGEKANLFYPEMSYTNEELQKIVDEKGEYASLFLNQGGFGEDISFCRRARYCGFKLYLAGKLQVGHLENRAVIDTHYYKYNKEKIDKEVKTSDVVEGVAK